MTRKLISDWLYINIVEGINCKGAWENLGVDEWIFVYLDYAVFTWLWRLIKAHQNAHLKNNLMCVNYSSINLNKIYPCWYENEIEVAQSCLTLCDLMDCSLPSSSIRGILQARILQWVAISSSRVSSQHRDQTRVSRTIGRFFTLLITKCSMLLYLHLTLCFESLTDSLCYTFICMHFTNKDT